MRKIETIAGSQMNTASILERHSELRHDRDKIDKISFLDSSRFIVSLKGRFVSKEKQVCLYRSKDISDMFQTYGKDFIDSSTFSNKICLGEFENCYYFVISPTGEVAEPLLESLLDLRTLSVSSNPLQIGILFYAQGLINWHFTSGYCPKCGTQTTMTQSGHSRTCTKENCGKEHFPRIEPAVIFSVTTIVGDRSKILLARQSNWPEKRYSVLAGFAEHGETLEMAVKREAYEEAGLRVDQVKFIDSQPWPFPASLMLGFSSETKDQEISLIDQELEHAQWLSVSELEAAVKEGTLLLPFSISISWQLIENWYSQQTGKSLNEILVRNK